MKVIQFSLTEDQLSIIVDAMSNIKEGSTDNGYVNYHLPDKFDDTLELMKLIQSNSSGVTATELSSSDKVHACGIAVDAKLQELGKVYGNLSCNVAMIYYAGIILNNMGISEQGNALQFLATMYY